MAIIHKSDHSLLASLGIAFFVITGVFAILSINYQRNQTTELRSRAFGGEGAYVSPSPKAPSNPDACIYVYHNHCYGDQESVDRAKSNYERNQNVLCYLPNLCPPAVEEPTPIRECPYSYGDHCYADARDRDRAEEVAKDTSGLPMEAPIPIDQN